MKLKKGDIVRGINPQPNGCEGSCNPCQMYKKLGTIKHIDYSGEIDVYYNFKPNDSCTHCSGFHEEDLELAKITNWKERLQK